MSESERIYFHFPKSHDPEGGSDEHEPINGSRVDGLLSYSGAGQRPTERPDNRYGGGPLPDETRSYGREVEPSPFPDAARDAVEAAGLTSQLKSDIVEAGTPEGGFAEFCDRHPEFKRAMNAFFIMASLFSAPRESKASDLFSDLTKSVTRQLESGVKRTVNKNVGGLIRYGTKEASRPVDRLLKEQKRESGQRETAERVLAASERNLDAQTPAFLNALQGIRAEYGTAAATVHYGRFDEAVKHDKMMKLQMKYLGRIDQAEKAYRSRISAILRSLDAAKDGASRSVRGEMDELAGRKRVEAGAALEVAERMRQTLRREVGSLSGLGTGGFSNPLEAIRSVDQGAVEAPPEGSVKTAEQDDRVDAEASRSTPRKEVRFGADGRSLEAALRDF